VKEKFVALAVDARSREFKDAEAEFIRTADCVTKTAAGSVYIITASGKRFCAGALIPDSKTFELSLQKALKDWAALPATETKAGAVQVGERGPRDPKRAAQSPPDGCLILRVYNRHLGRDSQGELRYTVPDDYVASMKPWAARFREPANDMMWVTKAEWPALTPANPRKGQSVRIPSSLVDRIFHFHLDPAKGFGESMNFVHLDPKANIGQLMLTVEEVTPDEVRMRLDGSANLRKDRGSGYQQGGLVTYQPRLAGYLAYDRAKKVFTRFDMVAVGDMTGQPLGENNMADRPGANPLGIAFELVTSPTSADQLNPRGARDYADYYLGLKKK
jgi:hypothetical protein